MKDLQDSHNKLYSELLSHNKELEKDIKSLRLENEIAKNKNFNPSDLTKKLELINKENEQLLKNEKDSLKVEQDKKVSELITGFDKEKENYKKRIADLEKNLREAEGKKGALLLELEKEKAKWDIEKDNLTSKYSELNDKLARLEKKYENLLRENEKLRNEKNMLRRAGATTTGKYSLMFRDGGNTLGNSIIGNLGKSSLGVNQNYKSTIFRTKDKESQENQNNINNVNNNEKSVNIKDIKEINNQEKLKEDKNIQEAEEENNQ